MFVVLACSGQVEPWLAKMRPGAVLITTKVETVQADECVPAVAGFIPELPRLRASAATPEEVWAAWPDKDRFQYAVA